MVRPFMVVIHGHSLQGINYPASPSVRQLPSLLVYGSAVSSELLQAAPGREVLPAVPTLLLTHPQGFSSVDVVSAQQRPSRRRPRPLKSHHNPAPTSLPGLPKYGILAALRGGSARAGESEGKRISQSKESPSASCFSRRPSPTCRALSLLTSPYYQPTRLVSHSRHTSFPTTSPRPSMTRVLCDRITIDLCPSLTSAARPEAPAERAPPLPPRTAAILPSLL